MFSRRTNNDLHHHPLHGGQTIFLAHIMWLFVRHVAFSDFFYICCTSGIFQFKPFNFNHYLAHSVRPPSHECQRDSENRRLIHVFYHPLTTHQQVIIAGGNTCKRHQGHLWQTLHSMSLLSGGNATKRDPFKWMGPQLCLEQSFSTFLTWTNPWNNFWPQATPANNYYSYSSHYITVMINRKNASYICGY